MAAALSCRYGVRRDGGVEPAGWSGRAFAAVRAEHGAFNAELLLMIQCRVGDTIGIFFECRETMARYGRVQDRTAL